MIFCYPANGIRVDLVHVLSDRLSMDPDSVGPIHRLA